MSFRKFSNHIFIGILFALIIVSVIVFFTNHPETVRAGNGDNVSGWAWSGNIGWISFNSNNCDSDGDGIVDVTSFPCPPSASIVPNYGVNINTTTGMFSGYAWSDNIGWIYLAPSGSYPTGPDHSACVDLPGVTGEPCDGLGDYNVDGWARACAVFKEGFCDGDANLRPDYEHGGWTGWIRMKGNFHGVWIEDIAAPSPDEFRDYAWGSDDSNLDEAVIGWISFNRKNCDANNDTYSDGVGDCPPAGTPIPDYKVIMNAAVTNTKPTAAAKGVTGELCVLAPIGSATFIWAYNDPEVDSQMHYKLQVFDDAGLSSLVAVKESDQVVPSGGTGQASIPIKIGAGANELSYNKSYYWNVIVWDDNGNQSNPSVPACINPGNPAELKDKVSVFGSCFRTPAFPYPSVDFDWTPNPVIENQIEQFCSATETTTILGPDIDGDGNPDPIHTINCPIPPTNLVTKCYNDLISNGDSSKCSTWSWFIPDPVNDFQYGFGSNSNAKNPYGKFSVGALVTPQNVTVTIGEGNGYYCSATKPLKRGLPLPEWKEIAPF